MVRAFIAIDLSPEICSRLSELQERLRASDAKMTFVSPDSAHFTLKFLGEISSDLLKAVSEAISRVDASPFPVTLTGCGVNNRKSPRVVWARASDEGAGEKLRGCIEEVLIPLGIPPERRAYLPHATLARVKRCHPSLLFIVDEMRDIPIGTFYAGSFSLKKSTLTPLGPVYEDIRRIPL